MKAVKAGTKAVTPQAGKNAVTFGVAPGVVSEGAGQIAEKTGFEKLAPAARVGGALIGAGGAAVVGRTKHATRKVAERLENQGQTVDEIAANLKSTGQAEPLDTSASRSSMLYDPPIKPPRPFEADYPGGGIPDEAGNLKVDIDGRPLVAKYVVGRRVVGGEDQALSPAEYDAVAEAAIGSGIKAVAAGALPRGAVGRYLIAPGPSGPERTIEVLRTLTPEAAEKVAAHELGHAIDDLAGKIIGFDSVGPIRAIPQTGIVKELRYIYNDVNNPIRNAHRQGGRDVEASAWEGYQGFGPEAHRYRKGEETAKELMAEAIRANIASPNYIKTVAPTTAAAIRKAASENPLLAKTIQFNTIAAAFGGAAGLAAALAEQNGVTGEVY